MKTTTILVSGCGDCPHAILDDNEIPERWGTNHCVLLSKSVAHDDGVIDADCPLDNA